VPLFWLSLAFLCGILIGWGSGQPVALWWELAGIAGLVAAALVIARKLGWLIRLGRLAPRLAGWAAGWWPADVETALPGFILPWLPLALLLGAARYQMALPAAPGPGQLAWYNENGSRLISEGLIASDPEWRDTYTLLEVRAERLRPADDLQFSPVQGSLLVRLPPGGEWRYGDRVRLEGYLYTPSENEDFSYKSYLAHQQIYSLFTCGACLTCNDRPLESCARLVERGQGSSFMSAIYAMRQRLAQVVHQLFPDPEAGLLAGILLGVETGISPQVLEAFRVTGTSHIIAISGFNFAVVAGLFVLIFGRLLGRWRGMLAAWLGIALYAALAGASASVIRSAIMGGVSIFAIRLGRRQSGLNSLAFVAAVMALFDPMILWDVGFQLSFMATLGLVLYAEPLADRFTVFASRWLPLASARKLAQPVGEYLLFTLAAQATTLPLMLYYFQQLSPVSLLANPLALPAQPPLMVLGGLAALLGSVYLPLGRLAATLAWPWIVYTIRILELLARAPAAALNVGRVSPWLVLGFYVLLFAGTFWGGRLWSWLSSRLGEPPPRLGWAVNVILALLAVVVWQRAERRPDGYLHVTMLEVGSGDAWLIQTPAGRNLLVDGGPSTNALSEALGRRLPFGEREIDYLVVAASGEEQLAGLPRTLERFPVGSVLWAGPPAGGYSARELQKSLALRRVPIITAQKGQALDLGEGARLEVLETGLRGAVLLVEWGRFRLLLPVGLDFESMQALMKDSRQGPVTALMLAEGGYAPLNPAEWIERWQPQAALLSVAAGDPDGLPNPQVLEAVKGYNLLRSDRMGWVRLSTDGEQLWVEAERQ
jgi:competence protein ComEC